MQLILGNSEPIEAQPGTSATTKDGTATDAPEPVALEGPSETTIELPKMPFGEMFHTLEAIWRQHSTAVAPSWVEGNDEETVKAVATSFDCPIGRPDSDVKEEDDNDKS